MAKNTKIIKMHTSNKQTEKRRLINDKKQEKKYNKNVPHKFGYGELTDQEKLDLEVRKGNKVKPYLDFNDKVRFYDKILFSIDEDKRQDTDQVVSAMSYVQGHFDDRLDDMRTEDFKNSEEVLIKEGIEIYLKYYGQNIF